jgi:hypothetical protein
VMVRLKKKRFIIVDYSIEPTDADVQAAEMSLHVSIPPGAGRNKCVTPECNKVGVPVLLYDSEPNEPASLYLRAGLCFQCQRNLNEKRRTERKRPSSAAAKGEGPSLIYTLGPSNKKFKMNGNTIHLHSDAIIVNGSVEGTKHYDEGYGFHEIGADLQALAHEAVSNTDRLVNAVSGNTASAAAAVAAVGDGSAEDTVNAVAEAATNGLFDGSDSPSSEDITALYDAAFRAMNKSIFLLTQWKESWDADVAAAHETVADPSLADAVASAAAVVAAAVDGQDQNSNMASLLLAADKGTNKGTNAGEEVESIEV